MNFTIYYVGFTSLNIHKVETECTVIHALFLLVCLNYVAWIEFHVVWGLQFTSSYVMYYFSHFVEYMLSGFVVLFNPLIKLNQLTGRLNFLLILYIHCDTFNTTNPKISLLFLFTLFYPIILYLCLLLQTGESIQQIIYI